MFNQRFKLLASADCSRIEELENRKSNNYKRLVLIIDNFQELANLRVKQSIVSRLSQMMEDGAAVGIHVILGSTRADLKHIPDGMLTAISKRICLYTPHLADGKRWIGSAIGSAISSGDFKGFVGSKKNCIHVPALTEEIKKLKSQ